MPNMSVAASPLDIRSPRHRRRHHRHHRHSHDRDYHDQPQDQDPPPKPTYSYLQRWLNETSASLPTPTSVTPPCPKPSSDSPPLRSPSPWHPHNLAHVSFPVDQRRHGGNSAREPRRKKPPPSRCSSIVDQQGTRRSPTLPLDQPQRRSSRGLKRLPSDGVSEPVSNHEHPLSRSPTSPVYVKRMRHKTRKDRYEPKRGDNIAERSSKDKTELRKKKKGEPGQKPKGQKRLVSGKEVMENFTSKTIHQDRLTLAPSVRPGLFGNGKTSGISHLPDLAFNEMRFLKSDSRQPKNPGPDALVKVRRERHVDGREMEDISEYFRSGRAAKAQNNVHLSKATQPSSSAHGKTGLSAKLFDVDQYESLSTGHPVSNQARSVSRHDSDSQSQQGDVASQQMSTSPSKSTTYYTWSLTNKSTPTMPEAMDSRAKSRQVSPSSTVVRRVLKDTGILSGMRPRHRGLDSQSDTQSTLQTRLVTVQNPAINEVASISDQHKRSHIYKDQGVMTSQDLNSVDLKVANNYSEICQNRIQKELWSGEGRPSSALQVRFAFPKVEPAIKTGTATTHSRESGVPTGGSGQEAVQMGPSLDISREDIVPTQTHNSQSPDTTQQEGVPIVPVDWQAHIPWIGFGIPKSQSADAQIPIHDSSSHPTRPASSTTAVAPNSWLQQGFNGNVANNLYNAPVSDTYQKDNFGPSENFNLLSGKAQPEREPVEDISAYIYRIEREVLLDQPRIPDEQQCTINSRRPDSATLHNYPVEQCHDEERQASIEMAGNFEGKPYDDLTTRNNSGVGQGINGAAHNATGPPVATLEMSSFWRPNRFAWY